MIPASDREHVAAGLGFVSALTVARAFFDQVGELPTSDTAVIVGVVVVVAVLVTSAWLFAILLVDVVAIGRGLRARFEELPPDSGIRDPESDLPPEGAPLPPLVTPRGGITWYRPPNPEADAAIYRAWLIEQAEADAEYGRL